MCVENNDVIRESIVLQYIDKNVANNKIIECRGKALKTAEILNWKNFIINECYSVYGINSFEMAESPCINNIDQAFSLASLYNKKADVKVDVVVVVVGVSNKDSK